MKILIWIVCFLCFSMLRVGYMHSGILLGAIPRALLAMFGFWLTWTTARILCKKWDQRKVSKKDKKTSTNKDNEMEEAISSNDVQIEDMPSTQDAPLSLKETKNETHSNCYCRKCGNIIDSTTKKCTNCGKQYFKGFKYYLSAIFTKKRILPIVLSVMLIISVFCNIRQAISVKNLEKADISEGIYEDGISEGVYEALYYRAIAKLKFYEAHVVVVSDDGSNLYHKYGCEDFDGSYFWAYNVEQAKQLGYVAHKRCCD